MREATRERETRERMRGDTENWRDRENEREQKRDNESKKMRENKIEWGEGRKEEGRDE